MKSSREETADSTWSRTSLMYMRAIGEMKPLLDIFETDKEPLPDAVESLGSCDIERCRPAFWFDRPAPNELAPPAAKDARSSSKLLRLSRRL